MLNQKLLSKEQKITQKLTSVQLIVLFYISAVIVSTILLSLPIAHKENIEWSFVDAVFTSVSAISVTGLTVVPTNETFSTTGVFFSFSFYNLAESGS